MQLIDSTAEWELRELQTFTSTLVGQNHVNAESNPFRPLVYVSALWDATCAVVTSQIQRAIVLRTAAGVIAGLLKNAWAAASTRLESAGVQPGTYRTVILPSGAAFGRFAAPEPPRPGALSALLPSMPGAAYGSGRVATTARVPLGASEGGAGGARAVRSDGARRRTPELEQALLRLDELLRHLPSEASLTGRNSPGGNRLEQHRAALVASASEPIDRQVIELATRLFESLLADSQLPGAFRPVIARMQIAVLRVVLADNAVLDSYDHPVWRLLDRIGEVSLGYSRIEDPRLSSFLSFASAVAEEMAGACGAGHGTLPPGPQPDRRPSVGAAAGPAAVGAGLGRCAAAFRASRDPAAAPRPATHRSDGAGAHDADDPPLRHHHLGPGDRRGHAHQGRAVGSDDARPEDGRRPALEPEDPRPSAESPAAAASAARPAESVARRHGAGRPGAAGAACRAQRADDDPHRGASSRHQGIGRAHARGDRAEHARRGPAGDAGAQLQRFGDRPVVDGDGAGRAHAERRRPRRRRPEPAGRDAAHRRPAARSSCKAAGAACSCFGAATEACSSCSPANRRPAPIRSPGVRSSASAPPG